MDYSFLDNDFSQQLYAENFLQKFALVLTVIAIMLAGLGLAGLTLYQAESRMKEVGIRKVLGASRHQVVVVLLREFVKPVVWSLVIALPVGFYAIEQHLQAYPYRIAVTFSTILFVSAVLVVLVLLIVSSNGYAVARKNPVDTLKAD